MEKFFWFMGIIAVLYVLDLFCDDDSQVATDVREIKKMLKEKNG